MVDGRSSINTINFAFSKPGDYSNIFNGHADRDNNDLDYSLEDDASHDGNMNWNQQGSMPQNNHNNQIIKMNEENLKEVTDADVIPDLQTDTRVNVAANENIEDNELGIEPEEENM